jgi:hypothetical protein
MSKRKSRGTKVKGDKQTITAKDVGTVSAKELEKPAEQKATAAPRTSRTNQGKIKLLRNEMNYKGNREAWFARLKEYDGKTLDEFLADAKERPPALTRNNTPEPPMGWFSFFKREGVATVVQG